MRKCFHRPRHLLIRDQAFERDITDDKQRAWNAFRDVDTSFLGYRRAFNYKYLVEELLTSYQILGCNMSVKIHFLNSHVDFFLENVDTAAMEGRSKGKWSPLMLVVYCFTLMRDTPNSTSSRQAKISGMH